MNSFMVDIDLPVEMDLEFIKLIPSQRALINKMMKRGLISDYSVSFDRQKLWVIVNSDSKNDVRNIIDSFPIRKYINFDIHNLLFHERNSISAPQLWLN